MRLSEMMSEMTPSTWLAQVALVICLALFVGVVFYAYSKRSRALFERASHMPLQDDEPVRTGGEADDRNHQESER